MNEFFNRIRKVISEVTTERAPFEFAAIVDRLDNPIPGKYDLLLSAPWIERERAFDEYFFSKLKKEDWKKLSRVIFLNPLGEFMAEFQQVIGPLGRDRDLQNVRIGDIDVRYAHLFATHSLNSSYVPK